MSVRLLNGTTADAACRALSEATQELTQIRVHGTDTEYFLEHSRWAIEHARILRSLITTPDLDARVIESVGHVYTPVAWASEFTGEDAEGTS